MQAIRDLSINTSIWDTALSRTFVSNTSSMASILLKEVKQFTLLQSIILVATFLIGFQLGRVQLFWKRLTSVLDIPSSYFGPNARVLKGRAISVSDGDTIRFLQVPTWFHARALSKNKRKTEKVSAVCLPIRFCTIDAPETARLREEPNHDNENIPSWIREEL